MKKIGNTLKADSGKFLKYFNIISSEVTLGERYVLCNKDFIKVNLKESDIQEVYPVVIDEKIYYVFNTTYSELVTELIRLKYSLDDELAIIANSRLGDSSKESEFQNWRKKCKEIAKSLINE